MKIQSIFALLLLALVPGFTLADPPDVANLRGQVILLADMVNELKKDLAATRAELASLKENTVLALDGRLGLSQDANGADTALFSDVNVQIVNGVGATNSANGLGNLIIGYNANPAGAADRTGSHNLVVGDQQSYPSVAEIVVDSILSNSDLAINVANNMSTVVGANQVTTIGANQAVTVGKDMTESIGGDRSAAVAANSIANIGKISTIAVGDDASIDVGGNMSVSTGKDVAFSAGDNMSVSTAKELMLGGGDELQIVSGSAAGVFRRNGDIAIDGKDISIKASGSLILKGSKIPEN